MTGRDETRPVILRLVNVESTDPDALVQPVADGSVGWLVADPGTADEPVELADYPGDITL